MEFFLPFATTQEMCDNSYKAIRDFVSKECGASLSNRKVFSLSYKHNGKAYEAEVGKEDSGGLGIVIAILFDESRSLYLVCTPNRGVIRGDPILVGQHSVISVRDFRAK